MLNFRMRGGGGGGVDRRQQLERLGRQLSVVFLCPPSAVAAFGIKCMPPSLIISLVEFLAVRLAFVPDLFSRA